MGKIQNAKISNVSLGLEDHGIFTCFLSLELGGSSVIGFGGYALDSYEKDDKKRKDTSGIGLEFIRTILDTVGVEKWEDLKGKYIAVELEDDYAGPVVGIRNVLEEDKWFRPKEWFEENYGII